MVGGSSTDVTGDDASDMAVCGSCGEALSLAQQGATPTRMPTPMTVSLRVLDFRSILNTQHVKSWNGDIGASKDVNSHVVFCLADR